MLPDSCRILPCASETSSCVDLRGSCTWIRDRILVCPEPRAFNHSVGIDPCPAVEEAGDTEDHLRMPKGRGAPREEKAPSSTDMKWPPGRRRKREDKRLANAAFSGTKLPGRGLAQLLLFLVLVATTRGLCPSKCICNDRLLEAGCQFSNLEVVPIQLNPEIRNLKLNNNKIDNIHLTFIFYRNLNDLDLSHNKIKTLGSKNFEFQINLINLNLSYNMVKELHKDSFKGLKMLSVLDLSGNLIEEVSERTCFRDLANLEELDLSNNKIYMVETGVFDFLINLKRLMLSENQLLRVPENAINTLNNLVEIDLNANLIEDVSFPANLNNVQVLKLRSNLISSLGNDTFANLYSLKYLDLSDNNFTQVSNYQFSRLSHLEHLNLSSNLFQYLGPDSFRNLYKLTEIYIDNAVALRKVDSKLFVENINLRYVSISNNANLRYLPKFLFLNKPKLKHVRISGNDFSTLDASDLPLDHLETLKLGRNPFKCNCSLLWLWILKERQIVNNCTCADMSCYESCAEKVPKPKKLAEEADFGFAFRREVYPIILDLDEIYCEDYQSSRRVPFRSVPKSSFDCTVTWVLILTVAVLATVFLFLLAVVAYILRMRCKRKAKNPVETFINATKNYEDTHHTYYRYGGSVRNGDVFEVLKSERKLAGDPPATNMYIRTPMGKETCSSFPYAINRVDTETRKHCRKQFSNASIPDTYPDPGNYGMKNYMSDTNIYQEPFAGPYPARNQRPPHIVYV